MQVGVIDSNKEPVLSIKNGDEVVLSTWGHWGNNVTKETQVADFPEIKNKFPNALGPHSITGPIEIIGAEPGDALAVEILDLRTVDHGFNLVVAAPLGRGVLHERFDKARIRHFKLDRETMSTDLAGKVTIPLRPFLGIMGVAPLSKQPMSTVEPGAFGGNIDLSELVVGTTLILPVFKPGALFYCGDAHAVQGDGEVNQTAIETAMEKAHLRFSVMKNVNINNPRVLTSTHRITTGFGANLEEAAKQAVSDLVDWLVSEGFEEGDAYALCSILADVRVTQMVNRVVGVHAMLENLHFLK